MNGCLFEVVHLGCADPGWSVHEKELGGSMSVLR